MPVGSHRGNSILNRKFLVYVQTGVVQNFAMILRLLSL